MKLLFRGLLLIFAAACLPGCGVETGAVGDENDPVVSGSDADQADEKSSDVEVSVPTE